jgi:hypothetical protein
MPNFQLFFFWWCFHHLFRLRDPFLTIRLLIKKTVFTHFFRAVIACMSRCHFKLHENGPIKLSSYFTHTRRSTNQNLPCNILQYPLIKR